MSHSGEHLTITPDELLDMIDVVKQNNLKDVSEPSPLREHYKQLPIIKFLLVNKETQPIDKSEQTDISIPSYSFYQTTHVLNQSSMRTLHKNKHFDNLYAFALECACKNKPDVAVMIFKRVFQNIQKVSYNACVSLLKAMSLAPNEESVKSVFEIMYHNNYEIVCNESVACVLNILKKKSETSDWIYVFNLAINHHSVMVNDSFLFVSVKSSNDPYCLSAVLKYIHSNLGQLKGTLTSSGFMKTLLIKLLLIDVLAKGDTIPESDFFKVLQPIYERVVTINNEDLLILAQILAKIRGYADFDKYLTENKKSEPKPEKVRYWVSSFKLIKKKDDINKPHLIKAKKFTKDFVARVDHLMGEVNRLNQERIIMESSLERHRTRQADDVLEEEMNQDLESEEPVGW
ncbi:hypothetical protein AKO1_006108 [Acrasis kona]|uniref:Pentatricopeptide repeat-containing protein n=1 Tax=Acrasis kona TaxID=1008807 RepID=A0AAW2YIJ2_9EUKA